VNQSKVVPAMNEFGQQHLEVFFYAANQVAVDGGN
jgi:hypothetical protein